MNTNILLYPILLGGVTSIGPYWVPPSIVATIPCQGADTIEQNILLMIFHDDYKNNKNKIIRKLINIYIGRCMEQILVPIPPTYPPIHPIPISS